MKEVQAMEPFLWIKEETDSLDENKERVGNFVSHCVPKRYEAYCKLLHPMYADANVTDRSVMRDESDDRVEDQARVQGERVLYKDLAKECGMQYTREISSGTFWRAFGHHFPRNLIGAEEGNIDEETCRRIMELLTPFTGNQPCYFHYFFLKASDWTDLNIDGKLFTGKLKEAQLLYKNESVDGAPTYWWPEDKSWCVCTDYDLTFTLIGGTREIVDKFLADDFLECIEVESNTRIDYKADENNLPT